MTDNIAKKTKHPRPASAALDVKPHPGKIAQVYVAVAELDGEEGEGIYSIIGPNGQSLPVVAVDGKDLQMLAEYAQEQVKQTGRTVSIIGFTKRTHHETFRPPTTGDKK